MSRRDPLDGKTSEPATLAAALRALPDAAPVPDLWPGLAKAIEARRTRSRWRVALPAAIAAAIALALLLPNVARHEAMPTPARAPTVVESTPSATTQTASTDADELSALGERSRTLERWIAEVAARAPQDGRDLMAAVEVEDMIGLVDVQLTGARDAGDALPLWRQRVALLEDLATIRGNAFALAANDVDARGVPASYNPIN